MEQSLRIINVYISLYEKGDTLISQKVGGWLDDTESKNVAKTQPDLSDDFLASFLLLNA